MSQEKAQLIAPQGHFTVPGLNVAGVVTASSFSGDCTGTASSIAQGTNVVVGVMTASSFAGDVFGNAAGLSTTTAGLKLGIVTATSFAGNFTGIGSGLTGTPNIVAGLVTATQFVGNTPGLAGGISAGKNLAAGIVTATTFYGDGSNLTGAGSTAYIRQTVSAANTGTTNINLNDGNIVYYEPLYDIDTLNFSNVKTADDVTIIRRLDVATSLTTGAVTFDGSNDELRLGESTDYAFGTGDFTIECWVNQDTIANEGIYQLTASAGPSTSDDTIWLGPDSYNSTTWFLNVAGDQVRTTSGQGLTANTWYHTAVVRESGKTRLYIDGQLKTFDSGSSFVTDTTDYDLDFLNIGVYYSSSY